MLESALATQSIERTPKLKPEPVIGPPERGFPSNTFPNVAESARLSNDGSVKSLACYT